MPIRDEFPAAVTDFFVDFRTISKIPVQWGDMDAFGHVNNVVFIRWFECARLELLNLHHEDNMQPGGHVGGILASINCDFKSQLYFPDTVYVGTKVEQLGRTNLHLRHVVFSEKLGSVAASGKSILVIFDYKKGEAIPIPEGLRKKITTQ